MAPDEEVGLVLTKESTGSLADDDNVNDTSGDLSCPICLVNFQQDDTVIRSGTGICNHSFHIDCIVPWLGRKQKDHCPCCRQSFLPSLEDEESPRRPSKVAAE